jgi:hypothetical protein
MVVCSGKCVVETVAQQGLPARFVFYGDPEKFRGQYRFANLAKHYSPRLHVSLTLVSSLPVYSK